MPSFVLWSIAAVTGIVTAWFNTRTDSPLPIIVQALITFALAAIEPRRAWRWALVSGVPAAIVQFLGANGLYQAPYENESWHAIVTPLPGFAAAYAAAMFRAYPQRRAFDREYEAAKAKRQAETGDDPDMPDAS